MSCSKSKLSDKECCSLVQQTLTAAAAAAAKSLQSCPTLCDLIDSSSLELLKQSLARK